MILRIVAGFPHHHDAGFTVAPDQIAAAAASSRQAQITSAACAPDMKAPDRPISEPNNATPSTLPVCRVELSTPKRTNAERRSRFPLNASATIEVSRAGRHETKARDARGATFCLKPAYCGRIRGRHQGKSASRTFDLPILR
jgi:hypothetical protein